MKITVTPKHIQRGKRGHADHCPMAIALNEQCPAYEATVGNDRVHFTSLLNPVKMITINLPFSAQMFVQAFDGERLTEDSPRVFDIPTPESVVTKLPESTPVPSALESVNASY